MKIRRILAILLISLFIMMLSGTCFASDPVKAGMPEMKEVNSSDYNDNEHITKYASNYSIDVNAMGIELIDQALTAVVNVLFSLQVSLVTALIFLFDKALNFSAYKIFDSILETFIKDSYHTLYDGVVLIILSSLGFLYIVKMIQRREVEFWTGIVKVVFVVAIGTFYYTNPLMLANGVEKASNELTNMIVKTSTDAKTKSEKKQGKAKDDKKTAITYIANDLWEQYVHRPWRILEFGDNEAADKWEDRILKKAPNEREDIIKTMQEETHVDTESMVTKRLGFMIMYLIPVAINIILMGIFCVIIIGLQFVVMLVFILGIFVFIVALVPSFGIETLKKWGMSIAFLSGTKLIMAFMLMLILAFNSALYSYAQEEGWVYALMLQLAMYIALYLFRNKVFYIFAMAKEVAVNPKKALDRLQKHGELSPYSNYGQSRMPILTPKQKREKSQVYNNRGTPKTGMQKIKDRMMGSDMSRQNTRNIIAVNKDTVEGQKAEQYLDKKYNFKKKKVDKMPPTKFNKDTQYVNDVDKRKAKGENPYTKAEIAKVKERREKARNYLAFREDRDRINKKYRDNFKSKIPFKGGIRAEKVREAEKRENEKMRKIKIEKAKKSRGIGNEKGKGNNNKE